MCNSRLILAAIEQLKDNPEQYHAVNETGHCVVLAGPGSGKTKTLTTAIGRALLRDVVKPRGIACITYNNECALELEQRLARLGISQSSRIFVGTIHSFSVAHVIAPYARCVLPELVGFRVATWAECVESQERAFETVFATKGDFKDRWRFATPKRLREVDRTAASWREKNSELADFIEAYEGDLRRRGLIDFDDMPLLAFRMIQENPWISEALCARFPILYVDEYQDLGYLLHALVMRLCFGGGGIRLFAVGDADQSIYGFAGANPELLRELSERNDVRSIRLRLNYRSGGNILAASMTALGEQRDYESKHDPSGGHVYYHPVDGGLETQAALVAQEFIPQLRETGVPLHEIAILYRNASEGNVIAAACRTAGIPFVRSDNQALIPRSNRMARFVEACAAWVAGGWKTARPSFNRLSFDALRLVYGTAGVSDSEKALVVSTLMEFLWGSIKREELANAWLLRFRDLLTNAWKPVARNTLDEWAVMDILVTKTNPIEGEDLTIASLGGVLETGRVALSTLHSAKGREFDAVILFGVNDGIIPSRRDRSPGQLREARRLFYVGFTRPRRELLIVYSKLAPSPWIAELRERMET